MTEPIGLAAVFETSAFDLGVGRYLSGIARATGATQLFSAGFNAIDQVITGFLRHIGADISRALFRFADDMVNAAIKGTDLETTMKSLSDSLAAVSKASFAPLVGQLDTLVQQAGPAFLGVVQAAETYLGGLGSNALTWGSNLVNQFAQGMWDAIGGVLDALSGIADAVSYWLSPGSPPKILPDIDQWGTDAANEWLGGWSKGNFSVFNDLSSTLTGLIQSLPVPKGGEGDVISRILGTREGIAQAVEELKNAGTVSAATMDAIIGQVGTADANVRAYLDSLIHLEAANQTVADAQDALNKVTAEYDDLLKPVEDRLAAIDEAAQQFDEDQKKANLAKILLDPGASASEKRRAQLELERIEAERARRALLEQKKTEVDAAQNALDAAKEGQGAAQDEFDAKKASLALLAEQNKLLKQQMALLDKLNGAPAGGGGAGGVKPPKPAGGKGGGGGKLFDIKPFNLEDLIPPGILAKWNEFTAALGSAWDKIKEKFQPTIDAIQNRLVPAFDDLLAAVREKMPLVEAEIGRVLAFMVDQSAIVGPELVENISNALDSLTDIWRTHGGTIILLVGAAIRGAWTVVVSALNDVVGSVAIALNLVATHFDTWSLVFQGKWSDAWDRYKEGFKKNWEIIGGIADTNLTLLFNLFGLKWDDIKARTVTFLEGLQEKWGEAWQALSDKLSEIWDGIKTAVGDAVDSIYDRITGKMDELNPAWREEWEQVKTALGEKWDAMVLAVKTKIEEVKTLLDTKVEEIRLAWETNWGKFKDVIDKVIEAIKLKFNEQVEPFKGIGDLLINSIRDGIERSIAGLVEMAARAALAALEAVMNALDQHSPSRKGIAIGINFGESIAAGISNTLGKIQLAGSMAGAGALSGALGNSHSIVNTTYAPSWNLNVSSNLQSQGIQQDFRILEAMAAY